MESLAILPPDTGEERSDLKQTSKTRTRLRTVDLAYAALFAVLLMVCAWINIPLTVPFTLQTFGVFAPGGPWGAGGGHWLSWHICCWAWWACRCSQAFREARAFCWAPTGGYILGFLASALLYWGMTAGWATVRR